MSDLLHGYFRMWPFAAIHGVLLVVGVGQIIHAMRSDESRDKAIDAINGIANLFLLVGVAGTLMGLVLYQNQGGIPFGAFSVSIVGVIAALLLYFSGILLKKEESDSSNNMDRVLLTIALDMKEERKSIEKLLSYSDTELSSNLYNVLTAMDEQLRKLPSDLAKIIRDTVESNTNPVGQITESLKKLPESMADAFGEKLKTVMDRTEQSVGAQSKIFAKNLEGLHEDFNTSIKSMRKDLQDKFEERSKQYKDLIQGLVQQSVATNKEITDTFNKEIKTLNNAVLDLTTKVVNLNARTKTITKDIIEKLFLQNVDLINKMKEENKKAMEELGVAAGPLRDGLKDVVDTAGKISMFLNRAAEQIKSALEAIVRANQNNTAILKDAQKALPDTARGAAEQVIDSWTRRWTTWLGPGLVTGVVMAVMLGGFMLWQTGKAGSADQNAGAKIQKLELTMEELSKNQAKSIEVLKSVLKTETTISQSTRMMAESEKQTSQMLVLLSKAMQKSVYNTRDGQGNNTNSRNVSPQTDRVGNGIQE